MKKLCLMIPTKDRPDAIEAYLESQARIAGELGVDIVIQDSSTTSATREIVATWQNKQVCEIRYLYYGECHVKTIDEKVKAMCRIAMDEYVYLCFSSDGIILHVERIYARAKRYMDEGAALIVNGQTPLGELEDILIQNSRELLRRCVWRMLSLSSTIVSSALMRRALEYDAQHETDIQDLWLPMVYFRLLNPEEAIQAVYLYMPDALEQNPYIRVSFWRVQGLALWQWGERWCTVIDSLPPAYDDVKDEALRSHDGYVHLFSKKSIIFLREHNNFSLSDIRKYRQYIPRVTNTPIWYFYWAAIFIHPGIVRIYKKLRRIWK